MKILSTKLPLNDTVTIEQIYDTITKWLKAYKPSEAVGKKYEKSEDKAGIRIADGYCTIETMSGEKEGKVFFAFHLLHIYHEQRWDTEIIYEDTSREKTITIHIKCSGDTTLFKKVPVIRTEIIRTFIADGRVKDGKLPIQAKPITANYDKLDCIVELMTNRYDQPLHKQDIRQFWVHRRHGKACKIFGGSSIYRSRGKRRFRI